MSCGLSNNEVELNNKYGKTNKSFLKIYKKYRLPMVLKQFFTIQSFICSLTILYFYLKEMYLYIPIICFFLLFMIIISYLLKLKSENTYEKTLTKLNRKICVLREGKKVFIAPENLLLGDYIYLKRGQFIPCDVELRKTNNFFVDEFIMDINKRKVEKFANITENENDDKNEVKNACFMGTFVISGTAEGIVVGVGNDCVNYAKFEENKLYSKQFDTAYQNKCLSIYYLIFTFTCIFIMITSIIRIRYYSYSEADVLLSIFAILILFLPQNFYEFPRYIFSLIQNKLLEKNTLLLSKRKISELSEVNAICLNNDRYFLEDKYSILRLFSGGNYYTDKIRPNDMTLLSFILCNDAQIENNNYIGTAMDVSILNYAKNNGYNVEKIKRNNPKVGNVYYSKENQTITTFHKHEKDIVAFTKGNIVNILKNSKSILVGTKIMPFSESLKESIFNKIKNNDNIKDKNIIAIGIKYNDVKNATKDLIFAGYIVLDNNIRKDTIEFVKKANEKELDIIMITKRPSNKAVDLANGIGIQNIKKISGKEAVEMINKNTENFLKQNYNVFYSVDTTQDETIAMALTQKYENFVLTVDDTSNLHETSYFPRNTLIVSSMESDDIISRKSDVVLKNGNLNEIFDVISEIKKIPLIVNNLISYVSVSKLSLLISWCFIVLLGFDSPISIFDALTLNIVLFGLNVLFVFIIYKINFNKQIEYDEKIQNKNLFKYIVEIIICSAIFIFAFLFPIYISNINIEPFFYNYIENDLFIIAKISYLTSFFVLQSIILIKKWFKPVNSTLTKI